MLGSASWSTSPASVDVSGPGGSGFVSVMLTSFVTRGVPRDSGFTPKYHGYTPVMRWTRVVEALSRHPRYPMAARAAVAAALAWLAVQPLGGFADDYPYYAPFGAVIAVSTSVASTFKVSLRSIAAIMCGAALAFAVAQLPWPEAVLLAIVVAAGVLVGGFRVFGTAGDWVPVSSLFVLVIGNTDRAEYAAAYLGLTGLGAVIGLLVNSLVPPLPLTPVADTLATLRGILADQLDDLADGLRRDRPPSTDEWTQRQRSIDPHARRLEEVVAGVSEARRANWRADRWGRALRAQIEHAHALQHLVLAVEDLTVLVVDHERDELEDVALGPDLRRHAAEAMAATADLLRDVDEDEDVVRRPTAADEAVQRLADAVAERQRDRGDLFAASAMVISLRRIVATSPRHSEPDVLPWVHPRRR